MGGYFERGLPDPDDLPCNLPHYVLTGEENCGAIYPPGYEWGDLRDAEICRNGKDDNGNGRVDEPPCTVLTSESAPECSPESDGTTYFIPKDPKARPVKVPPCEITLTPEKSKGPSPFGP